jgi:hypothetical protein
MLNQLVYIVLDYYGIQLAYYWFHRWMHHPSSGFLYKIHYLGHHKKDFPISKIVKMEYSSNEEKGNGNGGWFETGGEIAFGIPIMMMMIMSYKLCSFSNFIIFNITLGYNIGIGEFLHSSYHLFSNARNHPEWLWLHTKMYKYGWFKQLQLLHFIHHSYKTANFGFFDMTMDKIFGTYNETIPIYLQYKLNKLDKIN